MATTALQKNVEDEEAGEETLELVALRYSGGHSVIPTRGAINSQGKWPGTNALNKGNWYTGLVPDEGLAYLESRPDLDVVYADDRERFAEVLLERGDVPEPGDRAFEELDLAPPVEGGHVVDQLRGLAGDDAGEEPGEDDEEQPRTAALMDGYTREQLKAAADEVREDTGEIQLSSTKTELAEYLAAQDDGDVTAALPGGGDD